MKAHPCPLSSNNPLSVVGGGQTSLSHASVPLHAFVWPGPGSGWARKPHARGRRGVPAPSSQGCSSWNGRGSLWVSSCGSAEQSVTWGRPQLFPRPIRFLCSWHCLPESSIRCSFEGAADAESSPHSSCSWTDPDFRRWTRQVRQAVTQGAFRLLCVVFLESSFPLNSLSAAPGLSFPSPVPS